VARRNAEAQYNEATPRPRATLFEHLDEFEELWAWTSQQWQTELSKAERQTFDALRTEIERDVFRIVRNFARKAEKDQMPDFPLSVEHLARALNVTHQAVSKGKIRERFVELRVIEKTADHIVNRKAARFRWLLSAEMDLPGMKGTSEGDRTTHVNFAGLSSSIRPMPEHALFVSLRSTNSHFDRPRVSGH
jgi:hypothetical protein